MNSLLHYGVIFVNIALISYTISFIAILRNKSYSRVYLFSLASGLFFDISATVLMIAGSSNGPITVHGLIGYLALLIMMYEGFVSFHLSKKNCIGAPVSSKALRIYVFAYLYWIAAYITGAIIVMQKHS